MRKQPAKDEFEQDWISKAWRRVCNWNAGVGKSIKKRMNKRARREGKRHEKDIL